MTHKFDKGFCYDCISEADDTVFIGLDDGSIARITTSVRMMFLWEIYLTDVSPVQRDWL